MLGADLPSLTTGLRGLAYWEIEVTGPNRDLHSGHFGGAVANPINVLCGMISKVTDADGRIAVPGFYDDVEEVPQAFQYAGALGIDVITQISGIDTRIGRYFLLVQRLDGFQRFIGRESELLVAFHL